MKKICVTGATGFIGSAIIQSLAEQGIDTLALVRGNTTGAPGFKSATCDLNSLHSLRVELLMGCDVLIHCAANLPGKKSVSSNQKEGFAAINFKATVELAKLAATAKIKRFIFLSSIKVNGEATNLNDSFESGALEAPSCHYAKSKLMAEKELMAIAARTGMEVVIIRPPLVYGPGVKGNFEFFVKCIKNRVPLPFKSVKNSRSFLAIQNLTDFVVFCSDRQRSPRAANQVFMISDMEDVSTPQLIKKIANAYGIRDRLVHFPVPVIEYVAILFGKEDVVRKVIGNLKVGCPKAEKLLGWRPVVTMDEQLKLMSSHDRSSC